MNLRTKVLVIVLAVLAFGAVMGASFSIYIVRTEGVDGFWKRKRATVKKVWPHALPAVDKAEKAARDMGFR